ncbi:pre-rRNA-processing protein TSR2 homolog isoform X1 [Danio rerio]|uniref:Pre-rRNA-processing protein TSR2 homolog isoform X1 n=2 Tax=Danio rerio TaxID=7955 RepID=A0AC58G646_DANRE
MAPLSSSTREVFSEAVRAVLETWPVLQIAVDNGFGGAFSQQKAEWMVDALQQYFTDNGDLQQDEVEDFISELMNNEFNTVVDDGSLPQVAQQVCGMFQQCEQGRLAEVREQILKLKQKKTSSGRAKATPAQTPQDDDDDDDEEEAMDCEGGSAVASVSSTAVNDLHHEEEEDDGWTVVRRKNH